MHRRIRSWFRNGYPEPAPRRGHCYLLALCGLDYAAKPKR